MAGKLRDPMAPIDAEDEHPDVAFISENGHIVETILQEKLTRYDPEARAHWDSALQNFSKRLYNRAMLSIKAAVEKDRRFLDLAREQFETYAAAKEYDKAAAVGLVVMANDRRNHRLLNRMGNLQRLLGQPRKAVPFYKAALEADPGYAYPRYNLAAVAVGVETMDDALVKRTRFVQRFRFYRVYGYVNEYDDRAPRVENEKFQLLFDEKPQEVQRFADPELVEEYLVEFERAAAENPGDWTRQFDLGVLYDVGRFGELAIKYYAKVYGDDPANLMAANNLGVALAGYRKDFEGAKEVFQAGLARDPAHRSILLNMALIHREWKRAFASLKYFCLAGELLHKSRGHFDRARMIEGADRLWESGQVAKAAAIYQALNEEEPRAEWTHRVGCAEEAARRRKHALELWRRALELDPAYAPARESLERFVEALEEEARQLTIDNFVLDAAETLERAVEAHPMSRTLETLSELYDQLDERAKADAAARRAQELARAEAEAGLA